MALVPQPSSLVRYDTPILITQKIDKGRQVRSKSASPTYGPSSTSKIPTIERDERIEILDLILPPREIEYDGHLWSQHVSSSPATRGDVVNLQEELDQKLVQQHARETGICPIRRSLYDECFDEIIRQVTINCAERGLLLLRIRDELRMTLNAYETLYESSIAFGIRKALQEKMDKFDSETAVERLTAERNELNQKVTELTAKVSLIEKKATEQKEEDDKKHKGEIDYLKRLNVQLKAQLEGIITAKK